MFLRKLGRGTSLKGRSVRSVLGRVWEWPVERVGSWSGVMEEARRPWRECRCWDWDPCSCPRLWSCDVLLRKRKWGRSSARVWFETSPLVYVCRREGVQGLWVASLRSTQQPRLRRPGETTR